MPKYRAIIEGQNFLFMLEDEPQQLDFHRTVCIEAECIDTASKKALGHVISELTIQKVLSEENNPQQHLRLGHIEQVDPLDKQCKEQDFIWYFPDDAIFDYKLK